MKFLIYQGSPTVDCILSFDFLQQRVILEQVLVREVFSSYEIAELSLLHSNSELWITGFEKNVDFYYENFFRSQHEHEGIFHSGEINESNDYQIADEKESDISTIEYEECSSYYETHQEGEGEGTGEEEQSNSPTQQENDIPTQEQSSSPTQDQSQNQVETIRAKKRYYSHDQDSKLIKGNGYHGRGTNKMHWNQKRAKLLDSFAFFTNVREKI